jgi:hypothetical protein
MDKDWMRGRSCEKVNRAESRTRHGGRLLLLLLLRGEELRLGQCRGQGMDVRLDLRLSESWATARRRRW